MISGNPIRGGARGPAMAPIHPQIATMLNKLIVIKKFIIIKLLVFHYKLCDPVCEAEIKTTFRMNDVTIEHIRIYCEDIKALFETLFAQRGGRARAIPGQKPPPAVTRRAVAALQIAIYQGLSNLNELLQTHTSSEQIFEQMFTLANQEIIQIENNIWALIPHTGYQIINQDNLTILITLTEFRYHSMRQEVENYIESMKRLRQEKNEKIVSEFFLSIAKEDPQVSERQQKILRARRDKRTAQEEKGLPETSLIPDIPPGFPLPTGEFADLHDDPYYDKQSMIYELNYPEKSKVYELNYSEKRKAGKSRKINNFMRMVKPHKTHKQYKKHKKTKRNNKKQSLRRRRNTLNAR